MNPDDWIVVPNWDKFQHYSDRDPPWIKLYTELGNNPDFCDLTAASRGVLVTIWISFARSIGQLRVDQLLNQIPNKGLTKSLEALKNAGFIEFVASRPLALTRSRDKKESREDSAAPRRADQSRREKAGDGRKVTGWRRVRGSHGVSHIPDAAGTDVPPADAVAQA